MQKIAANTSCERLNLLVSWGWIGFVNILILCLIVFGVYCLHFWVVVDDALVLMVCDVFVFFALVMIFYVQYTQWSMVIDANGVSQSSLFGYKRLLWSEIKDIRVIAHRLIFIGEDKKVELLFHTFSNKDEIPEFVERYWKFKR